MKICTCKRAIITEALYNYHESKSVSAGEYVNGIEDVLNRKCQCGELGDVKINVLKPRRGAKSQVSGVTLEPTNLPTYPFSDSQLVKDMADRILTKEGHTVNRSNCRVIHGEWNRLEDNIDLFKCDDCGLVTSGPGLLLHKRTGINPPAKSLAPEPCRHSIRKRFEVVIERSLLFVKTEPLWVCTQCKLVFANLVER